MKRIISNPVAAMVGLLCCCSIARADELRAARGTPVFAAPTALEWPAGVVPPPKPLMPLLADWNGDGRSQLLVGDGEGRIWHAVLKTEAGVLTIVSAQPLQAAGKVIKMGGPCEPNLVDMTGSGRKDLVLAWNRRLWVFPNTGGANAPVLGPGVPLGGHSSPFQLPESAAGRVEIADWNGDGLLDVIAADFDGRIHVFLNSGTRQRPVYDREFLAEISGRPINHAYVPYVRFLDVNSDGRPDLVLGLNWGYVSFYLNTAAKGLPKLMPDMHAIQDDGTDYNVRKLTSDCICPAFGDVDGDGIVDMVFGGQCSQLFFAKGKDVAADAVRSLETALGLDPADLARRMAADPKARAEMFRANTLLAASLRWTLPGTAARAEFFKRYAAHVERFPAYYAAASLDVKALPDLAWFVAQARQILVEASDWDPPRIKEAIRLLRLTGLRAELLQSHGVLLLDNGGCGEPELRYLNSLLELIPHELHNLRFISVADFLGKRPAAMESRPGLAGVNIFGIPISGGLENAFPPDSAPASAPAFCACASHEVNHVVDAFQIAASPALQARLYSLVRQAAPPEVIFRVPPEGRGLDWAATKANFRRLGLWDGADATWKGAWENYWRKLGPKALTTYLRNDPRLMLEAPQEAFATLANQYFTDSRTMFDLCLRRWKAGVKGPINQFLFFADVYSRGGSSSYLYRTDAGGKLERSDAALKRDAKGRIEGIQIGDQWHLFKLDDAGWVTEMDGAR